MRLGLGVVLSHGFPVPAKFFMSYLNLHQAILNGTNNALLPAEAQITQAQLITASSFPVDVARNEICALFLTTGFDALLFLDADMEHPPTLPARLLRHQKPVVTARYHLRAAPYSTIAYVKHRTQDGPHAYHSVDVGQGLVEIERGGAGALLIQREVLQTIFDRIGHNWFRYQRGPKPPYDYVVSEDYWFYQQAREAGYSCWLDWDTECTHLTSDLAITGAWRVPYLERALTDPALCATAAETLVVAGVPGGLMLDDGTTVPEYTVTAGER